MPFCYNCGKKMESDAKFCSECGYPNNNVLANNQEQRKMIYDGEIHKCPNCGEILNSYSSNCPTCGYELRDVKAVSSVSAFAAKLEEIEANRENARDNFFKELYFGKTATKADEQKISLIKSFAIPNTKEDLYEFLILASSNINPDMYDMLTIKQTDVRVDVSNAWKAKFEQAYQKARLVFAGDAKLVEIEELYKKMHRLIKKSKWQNTQLYLAACGFSLVMIVAIIIMGSISDSNSEKKELARLEAIVEDIEAALEDKEYEYALIYADSLQCNPQYLDDATETQWEIQREYWIDKVIEEAEEAGIYLERPEGEEEEIEND